MGMHAMEMVNYGCIVGGHDDYNPRVYDDLLCSGQRIYAIATDDNHAVRDTCGGWTMIKADKLEYRTISKAMEAGHFYASQGPLIHELWLEDNKVHITCSNAREIFCHKQHVRRDRVRRAADGEYVTEAVFDIFPDDGYFRITVTDENGLHATTNAYFIDTLPTE